MPRRPNDQIPTAVRQERRETVLALLEERPYTTTQFGELLGVRSGMAGFLSGMAKDGLIERLRDVGHCWTLPGGSQLPPQMRTRPEPPIEDDADDLETLDVDEPLNDLETDVRRAPKDKKPLRMAEPDRNSIDPNGSWWTSAPREHFSARAATEHTRMRLSKEHLRQSLRILQ